MLSPVYRNIFKKDIKTVQKRGLDPVELKKVMMLLIDEKPLLPKHKNHRLVGSWKDCWDCHIAPNWLLLYRLEGEYIIFERTGSHADLF